MLDAKRCLIIGHYSCASPQLRQRVCAESWCSRTWLMELTLMLNSQYLWFGASLLMSLFRRQRCPRSCAARAWPLYQPSRVCDLRHHPIRSVYIASGGAARGAALRAPGAGLPQPPPGPPGLPAAHGHGCRRHAALLARAGLLQSLCPPPWQRRAAGVLPRAASSASTARACARQCRACAPGMDASTPTAGNIRARDGLI